MEREHVHRFALIVLCAAVMIGLVGAILLTRQNVRRESREIAAHAAEINEAARAVWTEIEAVEQELAEIPEKTAESGPSVGAFLPLITEPAEAHRAELIPAIEAAGFTGVIALSEKGFPGEEGCMALSELQALLDGGWQLCMAVSDETDAAALYDRFTSVGLPAPEGAYFPEGVCGEATMERLAELGIRALIRHRSDQPSRGEGYDGILAHGSGEWVGGSGFSLKDALGNGLAVYITVGSGQTRSKCDRENLQSILDIFRDYRDSGLGKLLGPAEAYDLLRENAERYERSQSSLEQRRSELEARRTELFKRLKEVYGDTKIN